MNFLAIAGASVRQAQGQALSPTSGEKHGALEAKRIKREEMGHPPVRLYRHVFFQASGTVRRSSVFHVRFPLFSKYVRTELRINSGAASDRIMDPRARISFNDNCWTIARELHSNSIV